MFRSDQITYFLCSTNWPFSNRVVPSHRSTVKHHSNKGVIQKHGRVIQWAVCMWSSSLRLADIHEHYIKGSRIKSIYHFSLCISCTSWGDLIPLYVPENLLPLTENKELNFSEKKQDFRKTIRGREYTRGKSGFAVNRVFIVFGLYLLQF